MKTKNGIAGYGICVLLLGACIPDGNPQVRASSGGQVASGYETSPSVDVSTPTRLPTEQSSDDREKKAKDRAKEHPPQPKEEWQKTATERVDEAIEKLRDRQN